MGKPFIKNLGWVVAAGMVAVFVTIYLKSQWDQIQQSATDVKWPVFLLAQLGMAVGMGLFPLCAWLSLFFLGEKRSKSEISRVYYFSGISKYLPGGIWSLPFRGVFYQKIGISLSKNTAAIWWELVLMIASSSMLSLCSIPLVLHYIPAKILLIGLLASLLVVLLLVLLVKFGRIPKRISQHRLAAFILEIIHRKDIRLSIPQIATIFAIFCVSWAIIGLSFAGIAYSLAPDFGPSRWIQLMGVFSGAWVIGFVSIAPGGIGVRDTLIGLGLAVFMNSPLPFVIAVLARIAWTGSEIIGTLVSMALYARSH